MKERLKTLLLPVRVIGRAVFVVLAVVVWPTTGWFLVWGFCLITGRPYFQTMRRADECFTRWSYEYFWRYL